MNSLPGKPDNTQLALDRTWLAQERTLMAWVRTATSMIGFGFTVYKFFQFEVGHNPAVTPGFLTPRKFALIIVSVGLVTLLLATLQHRRENRDLRGYMAKPRRSLAQIVAAMVSIFGILVLLEAISHH